MLINLRGSLFPLLFLLLTTVNEAVEIEWLFKVVCYTSSYSQNLKSHSHLWILWYNLANIQMFTYLKCLPKGALDIRNVRPSECPHKIIRLNLVEVSIYTWIYGHSPRGVLTYQHRVKPEASRGFYMILMIYGRSGPTTPPAPVDAAPNPCGPNTHPAPIIIWYFGFVWVGHRVLLSSNDDATMIE